MEDVAGLSHRVLVMNKGKNVMFGSPREVFSKARLFLSMGLDVPKITRIFLELKGRDLTSDGIYTADAAAAEIERLLRAGWKACLTTSLSVSFIPQSSCSQMDPRFKMVLTVAFIVFTFVAQTQFFVITAAALAIFIAATRIPVKMYLKTLKPIIPIIILTSVLNALYVSGGDTVVSFGK